VDLPYIHYSCQQIDEDDIEAVARTLRSDWLTQGPAIEQFEQALSTYIKAPHAIAVSSATAGLHLCHLALGIKPGDTVWTTPFSFLATANSALYAGAKIDFVDVDAATGNLCPAALAQKLATSRTLPKLVTVVHYAGRACDMEAIYALKDKYGFALIEDAAHALGANYATGQPIGSDARTDATVYSFHPVKPITTGEGGAVITYRQDIAVLLRSLRTHGIIRDTSLMHRKNMPAWYYEQQELGYNYRITDIQAALGTSQMHKLDRFIATRRAFAAQYPEWLQELPLRLPPASDQSGWHLYPVQLDTARGTPPRDTVFEIMREQKIGVNVHYMPIHLHPYYQRLGFIEGQFPVAENFFANLLSIPLHPGLTSEDLQRVAATLRHALS
jgi:UDP-4-amino-4,6-dideoxy-N-acetyl-beta-L-altrosamine transaminase